MEDERRGWQAPKQPADAERCDDEAREQAAQGHDRAAELHEHNAALLERHGAHRFADRERHEEKRDAATFARRPNDPSAGVDGHE